MTAIFLIAVSLGLASWTTHNARSDSTYKIGITFSVFVLVVSLAVGHAEWAFFGGLPCIGIIEIPIHRAFRSAIKKVIVVPNERLTRSGHRF